MLEFERVGVNVYLYNVEQPEDKLTSSDHLYETHNYEPYILIRQIYHLVQLYSCDEQDNSHGEVCSGVVKIPECI